MSERYRYAVRRLARDVDEFLPMYHFATRNYLATEGRFAERDLETLDDPAPSPCGVPAVVPRALPKGLSESDAVSRLPV